MRCQTFELFLCCEEIYYENVIVQMYYDSYDSGITQQQHACMQRVAVSLARDWLRRDRVRCRGWLLQLTERTEGGAFLYRFSRFLLAAVFGCAPLSPEAFICRGESNPSSASRVSGLEKALGPAKSLENVMSY